MQIYTLHERKLPFIGRFDHDVANWQRLLAFERIGTATRFEPGKRGVDSPKLPEPAKANL